ncbi:MAG: hypothetical protein EXS37_17745 [Opitutus sp.]|nr:hypothetical protein [Opitutus sp.]
MLRNATHGEELPVCVLSPKQANGMTVIWIDSAGKAGLYADDRGTSRVTPFVKKLLASGATVIGVDLFHQGEFLTDGKIFARTRLVNDSPIAAYTIGYNHPLFAQRVHDVLSVVQFARAVAAPGAKLSVIGLNGAGPWVAAARAQSGDAIDRAAIATGGFRFGNITDIQEVNFLPGGAKYDDLTGMLALSAPRPLWLAGEGAAAEVVRSHYQAAGAKGRLVIHPGGEEQARDAAVAWLIADR